MPEEEGWIENWSLEGLILSEAGVVLAGYC